MFSIKLYFIWLETRRVIVVVLRARVIDIKGEKENRIKFTIKFTLNHSIKYSNNL